MSSYENVHLSKLNFIVSCDVYTCQYFNKLIAIDRALGGKWLKWITCNQRFLPLRHISGFRVFRKSFSLFAVITRQSVFRALYVLCLIIGAPSGLSFAIDDSETLKKGETAFRHCAGCHTIEKDGDHLLGPNLYGIFGRKIASAKNLHYSDQLSAVTGVWNQNRLNRYIARPKLAVPGNNMPFPGITSPHLRADLIAWLRSNPERLTAPRHQTDAVYGARLAAACAACHSFGKGDANQIGPNLWGVIGRPIAGVGTYDYSERLMRRNGIWTPANLETFFTEKKEFDQGSHMAFRRLTRVEDRRGIIAWLSTLRDDSETMGQ